MNKYITTIGLLCAHALELGHVPSEQQPHVHEEMVVSVPIVFNGTTIAASGEQPCAAWTTGHNDF